MRNLALDVGDRANDTDHSFRQITVLATVTAAGMIAQQVAGKAIRDALFLSTFYVKSLPAMMAAGAIASLVAVILVSRILARRPPATVLPILFAVNAGSIGVAWLVFGTAPRVSAVIVYLAMAVLGPVILSTFWTLINEHFDPHRAKTAVARIASGSTLGGVIGGLAAWGLSRQLTLVSAIAFLTLLNVACVVGAIALRAPARAARKEEEDAKAENAAQATHPPARTSPFEALRGTPFLLTLAGLMALGSASSTLLDYTFSAKATQLLGSGPSLLAFFSLFGLAVSVLSFVVQVAFGQFAIERLGLMPNVVALQVLVVGGCALGLLVPGMPSLTLLRGTEMVHRNTLFKSAYELFYTPVPDERRRLTKAIIDVGFDRIGTVLGSVVTALVLWRSQREEIRLLWVVILIALVCLPIAKLLHTGYVKTLADDLREAVPPVSDARVRIDDPRRDALIEKIEAVRHPEDRHGMTTVIREEADDLVGRASALLRGNDAETIAALSNWEAHHAVLVPLAAPHLGNHKLRSAAEAAIEKVAHATTGALADIFLDSKVEFAIRRRVAPLLARCRTQRAADALLAALFDERLEVRYVAGRALLSMTEGEHDIVISQDLVLRVVSEELTRVEEDTEGPPRRDETEDDPEAPSSSLFDAIERVRVGRRFEHVFNVLALTLDREPLRLAFRAIHHPDERHRGTALEYIQTVLPDDLRMKLWPLVAPERDLLPAPREAAEVLAELGHLLGASMPPPSTPTPTPPR